VLYVTLMFVSVHAAVLYITLMLVSVHPSMFYVTLMFLSVHTSVLYVTLNRSIQEHSETILNDTLTFRNSISANDNCL
jgi:hypothetical protein